MGRKSRNLGRYRIKCCGQEGFLIWKFPNGGKKTFPKNPPPTSFCDGKHGDPQEQIILYLLDCIFSIVAITAASPPWPMVASTQLSSSLSIRVTHQTQMHSQGLLSPSVPTRDSSPAGTWSQGERWAPEVPFPISTDTHKAAKG